MKQPPPYLGSCLCGAIQYSVDEIGAKMAHCHCTMCRKFHGAAFATFGSAKLEHFHWIDGEELLKEYVSVNGAKRLFCDRCGSSLIFVPSSNEGNIVEFALGSLDSELKQEPDAHIFTDYSASWFHISDRLPKHAEGRNSADET